MENDKMTYFDIIKRLEKVLPSTTEFDYTKISPKELWQRVLEFLDETGVVIEEDRLKEIEMTFKNTSTLLYQRKTYLMTGETKSKENIDFDQNNYFIKDNIINLKALLMEEIYKKKIKYPDAYFKNNFGEETIVKEHISKEAIKKYITNMFVITAEKEDSIKLEYSQSWAKQIFLYFGLEVRDLYEPDEELDRIANLIQNVLIKSRVYHGDAKIGDHGIEYNSSSIDMNKFNEEAQIAINQIVAYVHKRCNIMLENGIKVNQEYDEKHKGSTTININSNNEPISKEEPTLSPVEEKDFDELMSMYDEMERLIEENKRIFEQLKKLETERKKLQQKLDENNAKLTEKMSHGPK